MARDPLEITSDKEYLKMYSEEIVEGGQADGESDRSCLAMINRALYNKYSSSQNYYYTKDINDLIANNRCAAVIKIKDLECLQEQEEYLKRFYKRPEYEGKVKMLAEYYKFHKDISRLYMLPTTIVLNKFHDRKRRVEYVKITRILKNTEGEENSAANPNAGDEYLKQKEEDEYEFNQAAWCHYQKHVKHWGELQKHGHYLLDHAMPTSKTGRTHVPSMVPELKIAVGLNKGEHRGGAKNISCSNTIQDLNQKLGEIICSNSRVGLEMGEHNDNESFTGLGNFLKFLKKNDLNFNANNTGPGMSQMVNDKDIGPFIAAPQPAGPASVFGSSVLKSLNQAKDSISKKFHHKNHVMLPSAYLPKRSSEILLGFKAYEEKKMAAEAKNTVPTKQTKGSSRGKGPIISIQPAILQNEQITEAKTGLVSNKQTVEGPERKVQSSKDSRKPLTAGHTPTPSMNGTSNSRGDKNPRDDGFDARKQEDHEGHRKKKSESNINVQLQTLNNQKATMSGGKGMSIFTRKISLDDNITLHNFTKEETMKKKSLKVIPEVEAKQNQKDMSQKVTLHLKKQEFKQSTHSENSKMSGSQKSATPDQKTPNSGIPVNTLDSNEVDTESPRIAFGDGTRPVKATRMANGGHGSPNPKTLDNGSKTANKKPEVKQSGQAKSKNQKTPTTTNKKAQPKKQVNHKDSGMKAAPQSDSPDVMKIKRNFEQKKLSHPIINPKEFGVMTKEDRVFKGSFVSTVPRQNEGANTVGSYHQTTNTPSSTHNNSGVEGNQNTSQSIHNSSKPIMKSESSTNVALRSFDQQSKEDIAQNKDLGTNKLKPSGSKVKSKGPRGNTASRKVSGVNGRQTGKESNSQRPKPKFSLNTRHSSLGLTNSQNLLGVPAAQSNENVEDESKNTAKFTNEKARNSFQKAGDIRGNIGKANLPVSKMYNFLNERSNSTSTDTGIIHSSRMNSNYKPSSKKFI